MRYCPHCSEPVKANSKICPACRKAIDLSQLAGMYKEGESSHIDRTARRSVWFRENALIIYPLIALLIGLVAGAITAYSYALIQSSSHVSELDREILALQDTISTLKKANNSTVAQTNLQMAVKDSIIQILDEQKLTLSKIINFNRRLARNSTITENTPGESDFYRRNTRYLIRIYEQQNDQLKKSGHQNLPEFNLQTVPQFLQE